MRLAGHLLPRARRAGAGGVADKQLGMKSCVGMEISREYHEAEAALAKGMACADGSQTLCDKFPFHRGGSVRARALTRRRMVVVRSSAAQRLDRRISLMVALCESLQQKLQRTSCSCTSCSGRKQQQLQQHQLHRQPQLLLLQQQLLHLQQQQLHLQQKQLHLQQNQLHLPWVR